MKQVTVSADVGSEVGCSLVPEARSLAVLDASTLSATYQKLTLRASCMIRSPALDRGRPKFALRVNVVPDTL